MADMGARKHLAAMLRCIIAGGDITNEELSAGIPDPSALKGAELKAWYGLSYWADDTDIRERNSAYAPMRREGLARLLTHLEKG